MDETPLLAALGNAIRARRRELGLSQEALAHEAGIHRTYMGSVERAERNLSFRNLVRVARALDLTPSELLWRAERALAGNGPSDSDC